MIENETESSLSAQSCKCCILLCRGMNNLRMGKRSWGLNQNLRKLIGMCTSVGGRQLQVQCQPASERCSASASASVAVVHSQEPRYLSDKYYVDCFQPAHLPSQNQFMVLLFVIKIAFLSASLDEMELHSRQNRALESWRLGEVIAYCHNARFACSSRGSSWWRTDNILKPFGGSPLAQVQRWTDGQF